MGVPCILGNQLCGSGKVYGVIWIRKTRGFLGEQSLLRGLLLNIDGGGWMISLRFSSSILYFLLPATCFPSLLKHPFLSCSHKGPVEQSRTLMYSIVPILCYKVLIWNVREQFVVRDLAFSSKIYRLFFFTAPFYICLTYAYYFSMEN